MEYELAAEGLAPFTNILSIPVPIEGRDFKTLAHRWTVFFGGAVLGSSIGALAATVNASFQRRFKRARSGTQCADHFVLLLRCEESFELFSDDPIQHRRFQIARLVLGVDSPKGSHDARRHSIPDVTSSATSVSHYRTNPFRSRERSRLYVCGDFVRCGRQV